MTPLSWLTLLTGLATGLLMVHFVSRARTQSRLRHPLQMGEAVALPLELHWQRAGSDVEPFRTLEFGGQLVFGLLWLLGGGYQLWRKMQGLSVDAPPTSWPLLLVAPLLLWRCWQQVQVYQANRQIVLDINMKADEKQLFLSLSTGPGEESSLQSGWHTLVWRLHGDVLLLYGERIFVGLERRDDDEAHLRLPLRAFDCPEGRVFRQLLGEQGTWML